MKITAEIYKIEEYFNDGLSQIHGRVRKKIKRGTMKSIAYLIIILLFLSACSQAQEIRIVEVNHTIIKETISLCECQPTECICKAEEKIIEECDNSNFLSCQMTNARLITEVDYYKNLSMEYLINESLDNLMANLTQCLDENELLKEKLRQINESLG